MKRLNFLDFWLCKWIVISTFVLSVQGTTNPCVPVQSGTNWESVYDIETGKCFYTVKTGYRSTSNVTYASAALACSSASFLTSTPANLLHLVRPKTYAEINHLVKFLYQNGYAVDIWTDATCNITEGKFVWSDDGSAISGTVVGGSSCSAAADKLLFKLSYTDDYIAYGQFLKNTHDHHQYICEYNGPTCNPSALTNFDSTRMEPSSAPYVNTQVKINCKKGYYRNNERDKTKLSLTRNYFNCTYNPAPSPMGSGQFVAVENSAVDICQPMHCKGYKLINETVIPDVNETYKSIIDTSREYLYGEAIQVQCNPGYISYLDETKTTSEVKCGQSEADPSLGMWEPFTLVVCNPIRCKGTMPFYNTTSMTSYKAVDTVKDRSYSDAQTNRFPYYPNIVYIKCSENGYFFNDRKYDKTFQCNFVNNTVGVWEAVEGTVPSADIMKCKPLTCLTKEIVIISGQSDYQNFLKSTANLEGNVTLTDKFSKSTTVTIEKFLILPEITFTYGVRAVFTCKSGYAMTDKSNQTLVTCSSKGTWDNQIAGCIKQSQSIDVAPGKKYIPPAKEAGQAASLGAVVIVIVVLFFVAILILDLTTLSRDMKLMRRNLRRIREHRKRNE